MPVKGAFQTIKFLGLLKSHDDERAVTTMPLRCLESRLLCDLPTHSERTSSFSRPDIDVNGCPPGWSDQRLSWPGHLGDSSAAKKPVAAASASDEWPLAVGEPQEAPQSEALAAFKDED